MSFNDFIHKYKLKSKATSIIKMQKILSSLSLSDVGIYLGDGPQKSDIGIVNLNPFHGTHTVIFFTNAILIHMGLHHLTNYLTFS